MSMIEGLMYNQMLDKYCPGGDRYDLHAAYLDGKLEGRDLDDFRERYLTDNAMLVVTMRRLTEALKR